MTCLVQKREDKGNKIVINDKFRSKKEEEKEKLWTLVICDRLV